MSSISGVGVDLYNLLQQQSTLNSATTGSTIAAPPPPSDTDGDDDSQVQSGQQTHGHHHGHHGLQGQIESAVTTALDDPNSAGDPNQAVQNAIASVLQNGADGTNPGGNGAASGGGGATDSTNPSQFAQLLQSNGISPQQFQSDLQAALSDNGSGGQSISFSTLFQSFPPGTNIDTTA